MLTVPPILSTDIYRYVWDGRVQASGYQSVPLHSGGPRSGDPAGYGHLPADQSRRLRAHDLSARSRRWSFAAVGRIWDSVMGMRLAMLGIRGAGHRLPAAAAAAGRGCRASASSSTPGIRSLCGRSPMTAMWMRLRSGCSGLALLLRARHKDGWAGAALAGAVLAKFFPLVVAPALLRGGRFWRPALAGSRRHCRVLRPLYRRRLACVRIFALLRPGGGFGQRPRDLAAGRSRHADEAPSGRHADLRRLRRRRLPCSCRWRSSASRRPRTTRRHCAATPRCWPPPRWSPPARITTGISPGSHCPP